MADRDYTIVAPDGRELVITGPDNATPQQLRAAAEAAFARAPKQETADITGMLGPKQRAQLEADKAKGEATGKNAALGALRGLATDIGDTVLNAGAKFGSHMYGALGFGKDEVQAANTDRQQRSDAAYRANADTDSLAFQGGRIAGNVAATYPVGGILGQRATAIGATRLGNALASGGMRTGSTVGPTLGAKAADMGIRMAGGAGTGYVSTGLVNPEQANTGAVAGALLPPALKVAGEVGKKVGGGIAAVTRNALGLSTGVGAVPVSQAFKAGQTANPEFLANMRGNVPLTDVLDEAKQGLEAMRAAKSAQYRSGMVPIAADKSVLSLSAVDKALNDAAAVTAYKGQVKNSAAASAVEKMRAVVDEWRQLDPAEFHTPEGLDALKQKLGAIMEEIPFEQRTARLAAGKVYDAAKSTIQTQAPAYAKVMKEYADASTQITEIERALSLGDKASKDTAMRKLQSLMRNNVQTNYGNRLSLANTLEQEGGVDLLPSLAGQAMNSLTPRSLSGQLGGGATTLGAMMTSNPFLLTALPLQSPRIVGELAYGAGRFAGGAGSVVRRVAPGQSALGVNALSQLPDGGVRQFGYRALPLAVTADR